MPEVLRHKKIIAVEGKDDANFFNALLRHIKITDVDIREVGGKIQFRDKLPALFRTPGFSEVSIFAVIRDADNNAEAALESIKNILKKEGFNPPKKMNSFSGKSPEVGIFIMPGNSEKGMLEDLCLKTVENNPVMTCVKPFIESCLKLQSPPSNIAKASAQAFLAAMPEIVNSVGVGAEKGYWNFNSPMLDELKRFLINFSTDSLKTDPD